VPEVDNSSDEDRKACNNSVPANGISIILQVPLNYRVKQLVAPWAVRNRTIEPLETIEGSILQRDSSRHKFLIQICQLDIQIRALHMGSLSTRRVGKAK